MVDETRYESYKYSQNDDSYGTPSVKVGTAGMVESLINAPHNSHPAYEPLPLPLPRPPLPEPRPLSPRPP